LREGEANIGAYLAPGGIISPTMHLGGLAGTYMTPAIYVEVSAVFTNTSSPRSTTAVTWSGRRSA
jgi:hypothetical protein